MFFLAPLISGIGSLIGGSAAAIGGAASAIGSIGSAGLSAAGALGSSALSTAGALGAGTLPRVAGAIGSSALSTTGAIAGTAVAGAGGVIAAAPGALVTLANVLPAVGSTYQQIVSMFDPPDPPPVKWETEDTRPPPVTPLPTLPNINIQPAGFSQGTLPVIRTVQAAQTNQNYLLLAGLGLAAILLLKGK